MKKVVIILVLILAVLFFIRFVISGSEDTWICDEEKGEWVKHGNPSAPEPITDCGNEIAPNKDRRDNQIEKCHSQSGKTLFLDEALIIAGKKCLGGKLNIQKEYFCNSSTGTWWIGFEPDEPKEGCNPACVVFVDTGETEINWRCTGLIAPK
ncbi:hypothetical protein A2159_00170 [Candidatus Woesebacteria bacterium RBG_13_34_9]|uniref:Uncharacterized protein n=1 Tax=Candidatus Woesebacteria bacterium RBG_13_34_9 TaxID=1802477 RepID=A0A1F7X382_9BACT|nr:MAG: hypothetical protein A2159_00170 [Candidatus Woesebacteria bacterium RBG_13_34_9]